MEKKTANKVKKTVEKEKLTKRSDEDKKIIKNRLNRISGQISGIIKMVDDDRYCNDILIQLSAVSSAAKSLATLVIENHLRSCVKKQLDTSNEEVVEEVVELFKRF